MVYAFDLETYAPSQTLTSFGQLVNIFIFNAFVAAGVISFIFLVIGGIGVIMGAGGGDTKRLEKGKQTITGAAIGLILILVSYWIVQIIQYMTGLSLLGQR